MSVRALLAALLLVMAGPALADPAIGKRVDSLPDYAGISAQRRKVVRRGATG